MICLRFRCGAKVAQVTVAAMKRILLLLCALGLISFEVVQRMSRPIDEVFGSCSEDEGPSAASDDDPDYIPPSREVCFE